MRNRSESDMIKMKRFQLGADQSQYYKALHMVSRRQQRLRLARRKQVIKKTKSLLIKTNSICSEYYAKNMDKVQYFKDCNVNYLVQETPASIVQLSTNEQPFHLYTNNIDRVEVKNE